jgi:hypothetical protein
MKFLLRRASGLYAKLLVFIRDVVGKPDALGIGRRSGAIKESLGKGFRPEFLFFEWLFKFLNPPSAILLKEGFLTGADERGKNQAKRRTGASLFCFAQYVVELNYLSKLCNTATRA